MSQISSTSAPPQLQKHKASAWELAQERFPGLLHEHGAGQSYQPFSARGFWGCSPALLPASAFPPTHTPFTLRPPISLIFSPPFPPWCPPSPI